MPSFILYCMFLLTVLTTTTMTVLRSFVRDYPGELVPEETLTHPPSWSSSNLYQLLPSTTIHSILLVQITCLANLFAQPLSMSSSSFQFLSFLPLGLEPSTSYSVHTYIHTYITVLTTVILISFSMSTYATLPRLFRDGCQTAAMKDVASFHLCGPRKDEVISSDCR